MKLKKIDIVIVVVVAAVLGFCTFVVYLTRQDLELERTKSQTLEAQLNHETDKLIASKNSEKRLGEEKYLLNKQLKEKQEEINSLQGRIDAIEKEVENVRNGLKFIWSSPFIGGRISVLLSEDGSIPTFEDYKASAMEIGEYALTCLDQAEPVKEIINNFPSEKELVDFFTEKSYGECRHRATIGFWFLQELYPKEDIWLVTGHFIRTNKGGSVNQLNALDANHMWVEMDGKIFDFTGGNGEYHPFVRVNIRQGEDMSIAFILPDMEEIRQEYERDRSS